METEKKWLLLVASLPTSGATARMRVWRTIKTLGCTSLRDGAYLLPKTPPHEEQLEELARQTNSDGGQAYLVELRPRTTQDALAFVLLFDRLPEYEELLARMTQLRKSLASEPTAELSKQLNRLRKDYDRVRRIDFFPNAATENFEMAWLEFEEAVKSVVDPSEPHAQLNGIRSLDRSAYQNRTWATRQNMWADRVASAWLIRRFIDQHARFLWLASTGDCPSDALGFDFDAAAFSHVGDKVTFEVLLASFGLADDQALQKLAQTVHALDIGGAMTPEAAGFEAILSGASARLKNDDALLAEIGTVFDSLYTYYSKDNA